jgi:predicted lipid-binding transport protein (Tim44 family)
MERERIITIGIIVGLFGGLVGGPIASLEDYYASRRKMLSSFLVPEFIGFVFLGLMVHFGRSRKKQTNYDKEGHL